MFSDIVTGETVINPRQVYTLTWETGELFLWRSAEWLQENLQKYVRSVGKILNIERPLFSSRFVINFVPSVKTTASEINSIIGHGFRGLGYNSARLIQSETGQISTRPGGLKEALPETGKIVGETVAEALKPVTPVLVIGVIGLIAISAMKR